MQSRKQRTETAKRLRKMLGTAATLRQKLRRHELTEDSFQKAIDEMIERFEEYIKHEYEKTNWGDDPDLQEAGHGEAGAAAMDRANT